MIRHVLTLRIFGALKKLCFWQNREKVFKWFNSTNWVELYKDHVHGSRGEITCMASRAGGMRVARGDLHLQMSGVIIVQILQVKRRCQLVIRLKVNKCYQGLLCYLSFYINDVTTPGFVPIVLQTILLWFYHSGRIVDCIALIVFVFGSVFYFWYCSHHLLLKVRAVQDVIHLPDESGTCILQVVFQ